MNVTKVLWPQTFIGPHTLTCLFPGPLQLELYDFTTACGLRSSVARLGLLSASGYHKVAIDIRDIGHHDVALMPVDLR